MATRVEITTDEIFDALAEAARERGKGPKGARTVEEMAVKTGRRPQMIREALMRLKKAGRLVVHSVPRERLDGFVRAVPAYTILPAKKPR